MEGAVLLCPVAIWGSRGLGIKTTEGSCCGPAYRRVYYIHTYIHCTYVLYILYVYVHPVQHIDAGWTGASRSARRTPRIPHRPMILRSIAHYTMSVDRRSVFTSSTGTDIQDNTRWASCYTGIMLYVQL